MQEENLFPTLTVLEAMEFAVKFKIGNSLSRDECSKKIMKTLMTLGLEGKIDDFCGGLSGGQKKRLSIALELVDDPPVLFLDEPVILNLILLHFFNDNFTLFIIHPDNWPRLIFNNTMYTFS
jgi:ABC-type multidrug transport system ATPase subunit